MNASICVNSFAISFDLTDKVPAFLAVLVDPLVGAGTVHQSAVLSVV